MCMISERESRAPREGGQRLVCVERERGVEGV